MRDVHITARRLAARRPLDLVVIDYLQLLRGDEDNENTRYGRMMKEAKALARQLECVVLMLSQLNRDLEKRPSKRPILSDLRSSGEIEQDADVILFIYRAELYKKDDEPGIAELICAKVKNGRRGKAKLGFDGDRMLFYDRGTQKGLAFA